MLAPTDGALGKPIVTNRAVPIVMRDAFNLGSGLIAKPDQTLYYGAFCGCRVAPAW